MARTIRQDQDGGSEARCAATTVLREARAMERRAYYSPSRAGDILRRARASRALAARLLETAEART